MALCHLLGLCAKVLGLRVKEIHVSAVRGLVSDRKQTTGHTYRPVGSTGPWGEVAASTQQLPIMGTWML